MPCPEGAHKIHVIVLLITGNYLIATNYIASAHANLHRGITSTVAMFLVAEPAKHHVMGLSRSMSHMCTARSTEPHDSAPLLASWLPS